ncbi:MAG: hypothetical protein A2Z32_13200 [Chloroflexi bacterium RBG_16_69_14]|nr:MAG: hypothetical protein A2Z32_13200 [Chloroflexi bacterium RBG_16_69_14]
MGSMWQRARLAGIAGAALAVLASGIVAGAAGGAIIMGASNSAGVTNTSLTTTSSGTAFYVTQNGTGTAMRANSTGLNAIAGFYTSANGPGISGVTANADKYAVYAGNDALTAGTGAALRAAGKSNVGIIANSTGAHAIDASGVNTAISGTATGCTGFICFGATGVYGTGYGLGSGVVGDGFFGVYGDGAYGVYGVSSTQYAYGVYGANSTGIGVYGAGANAGSVDSCGDTAAYWCSGGVFAGDHGVLGQSNTVGGVGTVGVAGAAGAFGIWSVGPAYVTGDLTVTGAKTGYVADYAINGSKVTLHQGDAVTLLGVKPAAVGNIPLLVVGPAKAGDTVIGVVDREMSPTPATIKVPGSSRIERGPDGSEKTVKTPARTLDAQVKGFTATGPNVGPGKYLLVVTLGAYAYGSADASAGAIKAGDQLMAGPTAGKLVKADRVTVSGKSFTVPGTSVGYALGALSDGTGKIGIFVSPH